MTKLKMTLKLLLTSFCLTPIVFSCSFSNSNKDSSTKSWLDSTAYPKKKFYTVTLFTLDSSEKATISTDSGTIKDTSILEYNGGFRFINKAGIPKTKHFKSYQLDSAQISRLEHFLTQQPCNDSMHAGKTCTPVFRNVFIFYRQKQGTDRTGSYLFSLSIGFVHSIH